MGVKALQGGAACVEYRGMKMYSILKNWLNLGDQGHTISRGWMGFDERMNQNPGSATH